MPEQQRVDLDAALDEAIKSVEEQVKDGGFDEDVEQDLTAMVERWRDIPLPR
jgi:hypothetical protein